MVGGEVMDWDMDFEEHKCPKGIQAFYRAPRLDGIAHPHLRLLQNSQEVRWWDDDGTLYSDPTTFTFCPFCGKRVFDSYLKFVGTSS